MSKEVDQIKDKLDIVEIVSSYIKVEKAGINYKAKCPFHNEKSASFFISPSRQNFYCFGCGEKGDIFTFVEKFEGLDFKGALQTLADRAGVELKKFKSENIAAEEAEERDKLFEILEKATEIFENNLGTHQESLDYLERRGVTKESIKKWRIGFAKDEWRNIHDEMIAKGYSRENLLEVGLIKKVPNESKYYDTFRNRVMFPICDSAGRVIAFSGRAMKEDEKTPKYLNSPETKLFYKSEVLHGFHLAKNYIRKMDYTVLVEGQMDLVMSHQAGVMNTVASSGTALTEQHLKRLAKISNRVIIAYDSDPAGEKASRRAAEIAISLGMETKIASLPEGADPADVVKDDPDKWKMALRESEHFVDFALNKALKKFEGRNLTKEILNSVLPLVVLIKSEIEKSQFVKKIAMKMKVSEDAVWTDLKKIKENNKNTDDMPAINHPPKMENAVSLERMIAGLVYLDESVPKSSKGLRERWGNIVGQDTAEETLNKYEESKEALIFEAEIHSKDKQIEKIFEEILNRIELESLKNKLRKITGKLDTKELTAAEESDLQKELREIQKRIKELG